MTLSAADVALFRQPFVFMRHGESEGNLNDTVAGSLDVALTARGRAQAQAAADMLKSAGITAIYSSALARARDTAAPAAHALGLPVTPIAELAERSWGVLEGQPRRLRVKGETPPGGETPEQYMQRVLRGFARIEARGLPLIVAHSGVFRVLCRALGIAEPEAPYHNAQPVRFVPPAAAAGAWRIEPL